MRRVSSPLGTGLGSISNIPELGDRQHDAYDEDADKGVSHPVARQSSQRERHTLDE